MRTDKSGKITRLFADVETNVAVGSELFEIQVGATVASMDTPKAQATAVPALAQQDPTSSDVLPHRIPLIHFKGKRSSLQEVPAAAKADAPSGVVYIVPHDVWEDTSHFRLPITDDEIEAVDSGFGLLN